MTQVERCVLGRDVCCGERCVLWKESVCWGERCVLWRDVCAVERCVLLREVCAVERCVLWRDVCAVERCGEMVIRASGICTSLYASKYAHAAASNAGVGFVVHTAVCFSSFATIAPITSQMSTYVD